MTERRILPRLFTLKAAAWQEFYFSYVLNRRVVSGRGAGGSHKSISKALTRPEDGDTPFGEPGVERRTPQPAAKPQASVKSSLV
jgi:hypothetical protein